MAFTTRDIRPGMDVYNRVGKRLGSVSCVRTQSGPMPDPVVPHEPSSSVSGELLGPMPTASIGNTGPQRQSANNGFGSRPAGNARVISSFIVIRWWPSLGMLRIPASQVRSVSLERVTVECDR